MSPRAANQRDVWFKLWGNLTMNPVGALTGANIAQTLADPLVGAVRELGQLTGVPTPQTDALLGLTRLMTQVRGLY